jgi:hypothetical protein
MLFNIVEPSFVIIVSPLPVMIILSSILGQILCCLEGEGKTYFLLGLN